MKKNSTSFAMQLLREQNGSASLNALRDDAQCSWDYSNVSVSGSISEAEKARMESRAFSLLSAEQQDRVINQRLDEATKQNNEAYRNRNKR